MNKLFFTIKLLVIFFVRTWQSTRTFRNLLNFPQCRFYPSCSTYFLEGMQMHGLLCGLTLGAKRVFKCHSLCKGGIDEVPHTVNRGA